MNKPDTCFVGACIITSLLILIYIFFKPLLDDSIRDSLLFWIGFIVVMTIVWILSYKWLEHLR